MLLLLLGACLPAPGTEANPGGSGGPAGEPPTTTPTTVATPTTSTSTIPTVELRGRVTTPDGLPLPGALVAAGPRRATSGEDGRFALTGVPAGALSISRPGWETTQMQWDGGVTPVAAELEPRLIRALRVSRYNLEDDMLDDLIQLAEGTSVNGLVFDTKDETGTVLYDTAVGEAHRLGAVEVVYDPEQILEEAHRAGLYAITRIVTFEDPIRAGKVPEAKLAGAWVDPADPVNWSYPIDLAVEACELGFDEIQFDYVRFPAGRTAVAAAARRPIDQAGRVQAIVAFLEEARRALHPLGCPVAADIFGIALSSPTDEGIGQRPDELSGVVDVLSPMIYPSHYSPGWIGFADPNDHPGPVVADALEAGMPRLAGTAILRPWLQAFYYTSGQILEEIAEAESRGLGWMLWNAGGNYRAESLPVDSEEEAEGS